jgi:Tfp pilus assembly PilM family ATPase
VQGLRKAVAEQLELVEDDDVLDHLLRGTSIDESSSPDAAPRRDRRAQGSAGDPARRAMRAHFDAVAAEVKASLSYSVHQYPEAPVRQTLLVGGGAELDGVARYVGSRLSLEARVVRPDDLSVHGQADGQAIDPISSAGVLAIGLSQYQADQTYGRRGAEGAEGRAA